MAIALTRMHCNSNKLLITDNFVANRADRDNLKDEAPIPVVISKSTLSLREKTAAPVTSPRS